MADKNNRSSLATDFFLRAPLPDFQNWETESLNAGFLVGHLCLVIIFVELFL